MKAFLSTIAFERFLISGWKITIWKVELIYGRDSHGFYHKFTCPAYRTYIRELK